MTANITICPHCKSSTIPREKPVLENWKVVHILYICPLCNGELPAPAATQKKLSAETPADNANTKKRSALTALLGDDTPAPELPDIAKSWQETRRFCRDCCHFIKHPFLCRCGRSGREVNPMDDCPDFQRPGETSSELEK